MTTLSPSGRSVAFHPRPTGIPGLVGGGRFARPGTSGGPARLLLVLANTGGETVTLPRDPVPGRLETPRNDGRAYLLPDVPPEDGGSDRTDDDTERDRHWFEDCWRGRPADRRRGGIEIRPDQQGTLGHSLVADSEGPCLPTGTYRFETAFGWSFTLGVWRTDAPGPQGTSRLDGSEVPDLPNDGPTEWFHRADRTTPVFLRPSRERAPVGDRDPATIEVALFNHSPSVLVGNPLEYELLKLHEGSWHRVVPAGLPTPEGHLPPGATLEKRFELRHGEPSDRDDLVPVGHLGGGRYAVRFGMHRPGQPRQHAALLDVDAPRLGVSPSDDLKVAGADSPQPLAWLDPDGRLFDAIVTATRTESPADRTVIAEQVMHEPLLRNTIPLFGSDTEVVELHTRDHIAGRLLRPHETLRVSFEGTTYELVRRDD